MNKLARWLPAAVAPVVIVGAALAVPAIASAESPLPSKSPQQVLELISRSESTAFSGTVTQSSDLGLPDLSALQGSGGAGASDGLLDLLTASHTAKVYSDGGMKQRVQVLDTLAERDVVRSGTSLWLYDSSQKAATHLTFAGADAGTTKTRAPEVTPAQAAAELVKQLEPTTSFDVAVNDRVAGRATYRLTLTPKTAGTLVERATVAVDAKTGVPLEVSVYAKGQAKPAATVAFSSISYDTPRSSVFEFTPPKGTKVETRSLSPKKAMGAPKAEGTAPNNHMQVQPTVTGTGWSAIAELPAGSVDLSQLTQGAAQSSSGDASTLLGLLQAVPGGRGLQTALVSVLITDDGRVLVGAVPLSALENAAQ
ncbi:DUF2092 domain-containing protein [Gryllotalpicola koreensis]|uniref:Outer membrane lipoprotein carrier protein LolA n=1 Tax=Gryllotalpicola koreensis TaxID=993086 RepID=A0ABP7ZPY2_9MICO